MPTKAYRARIARSKAGLADDLARLAEENPDAAPAEFVELARGRLHCAVTETYAGELLEDAQRSRPRRP